MVALTLFQITVQGQRVKTLSMQHIEQIAALLFGVAEGQRADRPVVLEQNGDGQQAFLMFDFVKTLPDLAVLVLLEQFDFLWVTQELVRQFFNALRVGGREEQGLAACWAVFGDEYDVLVKAHVEHAIGLVENERVERVKAQVAAFQVIHDAPRCADDDVRAVFQAAPLRSDGRATAQRQHLDVVFKARQSADFLRHLFGQFARRAEHHGLHGKAARVEIGQQGNGEGRRFAAAGLGLRNQVFPAQRDRQAGRLDRRHRLVFQLFQGRAQAGRQG